MLTADSFKMPLETDLKLKLMTDEVKGCNSVELLQNSLIETTRLMTTYQHLLTVLLKEELDREMAELLKQAGAVE